MIFDLIIDLSSLRRIKLNGAHKHSWHNIKICKTRISIEITVEVGFYHANGLINDSRYNESRSFPDGEGTLGDVVEMVQRIGRRSWIRHWLEANRRCVTSMMMRSAVGVLVGTFIFILAFCMSVWRS